MKIRSSLLRLGLFSLATVILMILFQRKTVTLADAPQNRCAQWCCVIHSTRRARRRRAVTLLLLQWPDHASGDPGFTRRHTEYHVCQRSAARFRRAVLTTGPCQNMTNLLSRAGRLAESSTG